MFFQDNIPAYQIKSISHPVLVSHYEIVNIDTFLTVLMNCDSPVPMGFHDPCNMLSLCAMVYFNHSKSITTITNVFPRYKLESIS